MRKIKTTEISNNKGLSLKLSNYGARICSIEYPLGDQMIQLHEYYPRLEVYQNDRIYSGATIGPLAGRLRNARYLLDDQIIRFEPNEGSTLLHSGRNGFHQRIWNIKEQKEDYIVYELKQDVKAAFDYKVYVTYMVTMDDGILIQWEMKAAQDLHINMTNHGYFNLEGNSDLQSHQFSIAADRIVELDSEHLPTGRLLEVSGTVFDFNELRNIDPEIYDHNFVLKKKAGAMELAAVAVGTKSGIRMECYTTQPGLQFYTKNGRFFCFETQHFPDSPNQDLFPSTLVKANEGYKEQCLYRFSHRGKKFNPFG